jgi:hypothetical protein
LFKGNSYGFGGLTTLNSFYSDFFKDYYKGLYLLGKAECNQDDIKLRYDLIHSEKMKEFYKELKKTKISNKLLSYLSKDLMGYAAIGIDIPGYSKGMGNVLRQIYPTIPQYGEILGISMDIIDIFIDEDALYNIFTGDLLIALNGIKPVEVTHTSYDYDDNYNMTERLDTSIQMQPEVLFMAGIGNVDALKKILKLSVASQVFSLENGLYSLTYRSAKLPIYMKINDNILFVSNNKSFVENPVVFTKDKQLGKEHAKMFAKNTGIFYANTEQIARQSALQGGAVNDKILTQTSDLFKTINMTTGQKNGVSFGNCTFQLSKSNDNSIVDILKFLNEFYLFKTNRFD